MTALQTINLGTPPAGSDGDAVRTGFAKVNSNVGVLNAQAALTSAAVITAAQALTNAYVGKRVNINLTNAGTINMPAASTCAADSVILLRNIGAAVVTLAIASGSGDTVALSKINPGESAMLDSDGIHTWSVLMRGRTKLDVETFNARPVFAGNTPWDNGNFDPNTRLPLSAIVPIFAQQFVTGDLPLNTPGAVGFSNVWVQPTGSVGAILATASASFSIASATSVDVLMRLQIFDVTGNAVFAQSGNSNVTLNGATDVGFAAPRHLSCSFITAGLVPGRSYQIRLMAWKTVGSVITTMSSPLLNGLAL
ncbi:TPA: hypothetical protein QDB05_000196 [Burkholderia vietnamiensis]|nr:hypothetical protein [Burkholderia vietnamiensis]